MAVASSNPSLGVEHGSDLQEWAAAGEALQGRVSDPVAAGGTEDLQAGGADHELLHARVRQAPAVHRREGAERGAEMGGQQRDRRVRGGGEGPRGDAAQHRLRGEGPGRQVRGRDEGRDAGRDVQREVTDGDGGDHGACATPAGELGGGGVQALTPHNRPQYWAIAPQGQSRPTRPPQQSVDSDDQSSIFSH